MDNEKLAEKIIELCEDITCKPCDGNGEYAYYHQKKKETQMRECDICDGTGMMPSFFAKDLANKLKGL